MKYVDLKKFVREVPDYPKPGIIFKDITPLLMDPDARRCAVQMMIASVKEVVKPDVVAGIEARGFIFGMSMAHSMKLPFVPIRKRGKLPYLKVSETYDLEYGKDTIEMHADAVKKNQNVLIVDDILATGGTALAAARITERLHAKPVFCFLIELDYLNGREKIKEYPIVSVLHY